MTVQSFTVNPFQENCYVCHDGGEAVIIDPGSQTEEERRRIMAYLEKEALTVRHLLLTHAHLDHVIDCAYFARHFGMSFQMHRKDLPLLQMARMQGELFGLRIEQPPEPAGFLDEGDQIEIGDARWSVLHCPGHAPGSIVFYDEVNGFVIAGDVLFKGSVGRTDLFEGSMEDLLASIHSKLFILPDKTVVYAGHGPTTTIGEERRENPFLK
jgi:hydroxyacylglutathione hydrolase